MNNNKFMIFFMIGLMLVSVNAFAIAVPPSVNAKWLIENLQQPNLAIIEVSSQEAFDFNGHIPGSVSTSKTVWRDIASDGSIVHLPVEVLAEKIRKLGINDNDGVVLYYKGDNTDEILGAYYLYWLFHLLGHTNVGMLDEGWVGWLNARGPIAEDAEEIVAGDFVARPLLALEIATVELNKIRENYLLIDGRPKTHFEGLTRFPANPRYGRIPGSLSQPWFDYIRQTDDGRYYAKQPKMPPLLARLKVDPDTPLLLTCLGGTGAAFNYAVFYAAGYRNMRLDDAALRRWNTLRLPLEKTDVHKLESKDTK